MLAYINNFFKIKELGSTIKTEINAGFTTFLSMSYIVFVNPIILSDAGMDKGAVFVATILATVFATLLMGLWVNWPLALAPGMGTNAWFVYGIVLGMGYSWQEALASVFISGCLMLIFSISPLRKLLIQSIPISLKMAIAAGVGLFIALIGFRTSGLLVSNTITFASFGSFLQPSVYLTMVGLLIIFTCESFKIKGSIIISMVIISLLSLILGVTHFTGIVAMPPSMNPTFLQLNFKDLLSISMIGIIFTLFIIDFFDSTSVFIGTMAGISKNVEEKQLRKALFVDSIATSVGATLGVSTTTTYTESVSGVMQGGRTGLTSVVIAMLFLTALFISPVLTMLPAFIGAPAMIYIGCLMFSSLKIIEWDDITEVIPLLIIVIIVPLTFSIFNGIGLGICTWLILKALFRKWHKSYWYMLPLAIAFIIFIAIK